MTKPVIAVEQASKRYVKYDDTPMLVSRALKLRTRTARSELWAVRDADFSVERGACVGVIGRNGSGKSTLLRMLAGVTAPTKGRVAVQGRIAPLIAVGVGFHPELTGRENVYVSGTILGLARTEIDQRFDEIVDFAEIERFIDTPVKFYSSGMFVRLGFAVSVVADPDVLLVDEVLAVGDIAFQLKCMDRMMEIQKAGTTIVVVSHNLNAVRRMCDRTLVLHDGVTRHDGDTPEAMALYHDLLSEHREIDDPDEIQQHDGVVVRPRGDIESFELHGQNGSTNRISVGEPARLSLTVRFFEAVDDCLIGVTMYNQAGIQVYGDSSDWSETQGFAAGSTVRFDVDLEPHLARGYYSAQIGITDKRGAFLTKVPRALTIHVEGRGTVNGIADLGGRFSAKIDEPPLPSGSEEPVEPLARADSGPFTAPISADPTP
jgi:lipopolysaccharide transport system ATP-binding protein